MEDLDKILSVHPKRLIKPFIVGSLNSFLCSICKNIIPLYENEACIKCERIFCKRCVISYNTINEKDIPICYSCKEEFQSTKVTNTLYNKLKNLIFKCTNKKCEEEVLYFELYDHEAECNHQEDDEFFDQRNDSRRSTPNELKLNWLLSQSSKDSDVPLLKRTYSEYVKNDKLINFKDEISTENIQQKIDIVFVLEMSEEISTKYSEYEKLISNILQDAENFYKFESNQFCGYDEFLNIGFVKYDLDKHNLFHTKGYIKYLESGDVSEILNNSNENLTEINNVKTMSNKLFEVLTSEEFINNQEDNKNDKFLFHLYNNLKFDVEEEILLKMREISFNILVFNFNKNKEIFKNYVDMLSQYIKVDTSNI
jgi:hypothetical protein